MFLRVVADGATGVPVSRARRAAFAANHLQVRMFHVGGGECNLITFPDNQAWLVDAGCGSGDARNEALAEALVQFLVANTLTLDVIIPSHPHSDHAKAFTTLLADNSPRLSNPLTVFRSNDRGWHTQDRAWLRPYRTNVSFWGEEYFWEDVMTIDPAPSNAEARMFAGSTGRKYYVSLFMQLRFGGARLLFTGDAYASYERALLARFGADVFRSDLLKITHHGSEHGTDAGVLAEIQPGIAIASTENHDARHRLEPETRARIESRGTRIFETSVNSDGVETPRDLVIKTDGLPINGGGILYSVDEVEPAFSL